jgi:hypothetical protein
MHPTFRNETRVVRVFRIAIAAPPKAVPVRASLGAPHLLPLSLVDLSRELADIAVRDPRFERAASLAADLEAELARLNGEPPPAHARRRRARARRTVRTERTAKHLQAFEAEVQALESTCQSADEQGMTTITTRQLSDLRLGERTRRIFHDAGLLYVQDVASLPPEQAMEIPQLAPASVAEVRAAIMFAVEALGTKRQPLLLDAPGDGDLFEGLVHGVNSLPAREREVVLLRTGVEDRVHDIDEVARAIGCLVEQVPQLERHALNTLLSQPLTVEACWRFEDLCAQLGLGWDDERLPKVVATRYPNTRASFTRLVGWLLHEKGQLVADAGGRTFTPPRGIAHFEEMVVAALGRYGDLSEELLTSHVRAAFTPVELESYPQVDVSKRVQILGPALRADDSSFKLPDAPIPGLDDRHIRALNGLIGALQRLGVSRISSLTNEVNRRLPRSYQVNEQFVRTWLTRHPELFTQADEDKFKLASLDVDILCGLATSWMPGGAVPAVAASGPGFLAVERLRERLATEIADFLRQEGPQPIERIRAHFYGRFSGLGSADLAIARSAFRFARQPSGLISLRDGAELLDGDLTDLGAAAAAPRRPRFWRQ